MIPAIVVPCRKPAMTANEQRRATWPAVRRAKAEMGAAVWAAAKTARIAPQTGQIAILVTQYPPTRARRDVDGLGPFVKAALDALVDGGILPDDSRDHVASVTTTIAAPDKANPRIEIRLVPATQCWVCDREVPPPPACGPHCNADNEHADRYARERDHR